MKHCVLIFPQIMRWKKSPAPIMRMWYVTVQMVTMMQTQTPRKGIASRAPVNVVEVSEVEGS